MKYKVEPAKTDEDFTPFSVTLTFETKNDYLHFHDKVLPVLIGNRTSHELCGHVFRAGVGEVIAGEGKI